MIYNPCQNKQIKSLFLKLVFFCITLFLPIFSAQADELEQVTSEQLRTPLLRIAYVAESWGELFPCPG